MHYNWRAQATKAEIARPIVPRSLRISMVRISLYPRGLAVDFRFARMSALHRRVPAAQSRASSVMPRSQLTH